MTSCDGRKAAIVFSVALYAIEHGADIIETDNAVNAALNIVEKGMSTSTAIEAGKVAIAAITADKIIHNL